MHSTCHSLLCDEQQVRRFVSLQAFKETSATRSVAATELLHEAHGVLCSQDLTSELVYTCQALSAEISRDKLSKP